MWDTCQGQDPKVLFSFHLNYSTLMFVYNSRPKITVVGSCLQSKQAISFSLGLGVHLSKYASDKE